MTLRQKSFVVNVKEKDWTGVKVEGLEHTSTGYHADGREGEIEGSNFNEETLTV